MRRVLSLYAVILAGIFGLLAAGCVSLLPETGPAPRVFRLDGGRTEAAAAFEAGIAPAPQGEGDLTVLVPEPLAARALATDRVAVVMPDGRISYAADARWAERAPRLVQERVLAAFEDDPRVRSVVRPEDGVESRYEVRLDLLRFEADYRDGERAAPTAVVSLRAKLVDRRSRQLVATSQVAVEERAAENRIGDIVAALDRALGRAGEQVVGWSLASAPTGR